MRSIWDDNRQGYRKPWETFIEYANRLRAKEGLLPLEGPSETKELDISELKIRFGTIKPGDMIVIHTQKSLPPEQIVVFSNRLKEMFPGVKIVWLEGDMELKVYRETIE